MYLWEGSCRVSDTVVTLVSQLTISISKFPLGYLQYKTTTIGNFTIEINTQVPALCKPPPPNKKKVCISVDKTINLRI